MTESWAIRTEGLGRVYRTRGMGGAPATERHALRDVTLSVRRGELFGLLGHNGAGKSTLIKILVTLLAPSQGRAEVAGHDVARHPARVRPLINLVSGGEVSGYGMLTVRENLWMFGQFYGLEGRALRTRIGVLLEQAGLSARADSQMSTLSTGLRQRVNVLRGFLTEPEVLLLDEPTLGLDVSAGRELRVFVRQWMAERPGRTVLLTTHHLAEADELCDRVAILHEGQLRACDTPANIKRQSRNEAVFLLDTSPLPPGVLEALRRLPGVRRVEPTVESERMGLELLLDNDERLGHVIVTLTSSQAQIFLVQKREPTLEDAFVEVLTRAKQETPGEGPGLPLAQ